ncbi:MAG: hypothetical protein ACTSRI_04660 [Promethearchaeota archaeon]
MPKKHLFFTAIHLFIDQNRKEFFSIELKKSLNQFLDSIKIDILNGEFILNKKNIVAERKEFKDYKSLSSVVAGWLQKNTQFKNITQINAHFFGDPIPEQIKKLLNSKKEEILNGKFIPDIKNIIAFKKEFKDYKDINKVVARWLQKNTQYENVTDLRKHFLGEHLALRLRKFLDSKKEEILNGEFIPDIKNIVAFKKEFKGYNSLNHIVKDWLLKNTRFKTLPELKKHFGIKPLYIQLYEFLDSKKDDILNGEFIPFPKNIISTKPKFKDYITLRQDLSVWIKEHTPFKNATEIQEHFTKTLPDKLKRFLDSKKKQILKGAFFPSKSNIISKRPEFREYKGINPFIVRWLKKNTLYQGLTDLAEQFFDKPFAVQLNEFLNSKKGEIQQGRFIPTLQNIIAEKPQLEEYKGKGLNQFIGRWLKENTKYNNRTQLKRQFLRVPISEEIRKFFDSKKNDILYGRYFPTIKNLRMVNEEFGNYKILHFIIGDWLNKNSNSKFKSLTELIEYFDPPKESLGFKGKHGYTTKFFQESVRVKNAWYQVVRLIDSKKLIQINQKLPPKTWNGLFNFLKANSEWMFVDLITGEIITKNDYLSGRISFHHKDRNKKNDNPSNLNFILSPNHGIITVSQMHYTKLAKFFKNLQSESLNSIKNGLIPGSWKIGWRSIATKNGINLPPNKYKRKGKFNKKIIGLNTYIEDLGRFL